MNSPLDQIDPGEPEFIWRALFHSNCPKDVRTIYLEAVASHIHNCDLAEVRKTKSLVCSGKDIEAIEFASRLIGRNRLLTYRFRVMLSIIECFPETRPLVINQSNHQLRAWSRLFLSVVRSMWMAAKGLYLLSRRRDE